MIIQNLIKGIHGTHNTEDNDINNDTLQCNNGKVQTIKLFLASWSKFWKEILLGFDYSEDVVIVKLRSRSRSGPGQGKVR